MAPWNVVATGCATLIIALCAGAALPSRAEDAVAAPSVAPVAPDLAQVPNQYSSACRVKSPAFEGRAPLRTVRRALREKRPLKVLAIGSSSTVGVGASSPVASYPVVLENDLEGFLHGFDVEMITRGLSGESANEAAQRLKLEVAENRPDLVVWQVGTNDAMARVEESEFSALLRETLTWLAQNRVDVVLIDPQYVERLAEDDNYVAIVKAIAAIAREKRVLLVQRFEAMADLARQRSNGAYLAADRFHLNDLGYRCMAEYAARAIVAGILQADAEATSRN